MDFDGLWLALDPCEDRQRYARGAKEPRKKWRESTPVASLARPFSKIHVDENHLRAYRRTSQQGQKNLKRTLAIPEYSQGKCHDAGIIELSASVHYYSRDNECVGWVAVHHNARIWESWTAEMSKPL